MQPYSLPSNAIPAHKKHPPLQSQATKPSNPAVQRFQNLMQKHSAPPEGSTPQTVSDDNDDLEYQSNIFNVVENSTVPLQNAESEQNKDEPATLLEAHINQYVAPQDENIPPPAPSELRANQAESSQQQRDKVLPKISDVTSGTPPSGVQKQQFTQGLDGEKPKGNLDADSTDTGVQKATYTAPVSHKSEAQLIFNAQLSTTASNPQLLTAEDAKDNETIELEATHRQDLPSPNILKKSKVVLTAVPPRFEMSVARDISHQLTAAVQKNGHGATEITLTPEGLGRIRLTVSGVNNTLTVSLFVENPETEQLLKKHMDQLSQEFSHEGFQNSSFSFEGNSNRQKTHQDTDRTGSNIQTVILDDSLTTSRNLLQDNGLDIRV